METANWRRHSVEVPRDKFGNHEWKYHVFLSFRGGDTRFKFADHLYHALCRAGINTFRDEEELRKGDEIRPALLSAIEDSRISIIVLSKNYASSTWCLDELVKILECRKLTKQVVLPVFYEVDPSEVRHQTGNFGDSMARHEKRYKENIEKVEKWRSALRKVANLSGESYTKESEAEFIDKIIQKVSSNLGDRSLLHLPEKVVGLESRKLRIVSLLCIGKNDVDVSIVGIYGPGGIGKTTIVKAVYNLIAEQFESTSFFADVRDNTAKHGVAHIQQCILTDVLGKINLNLKNKDRGSVVMKERLQKKRVLLVLDNVDKLEQLQSLAGGCDWFGAGSRVIITTRDKQLLSRHGIEKTYEVEELNKEEALKLLCWNAFRSSVPERGYEDVSTRVLSYARGIPLALEIIGSHLFGKDIEEWESAMDSYKKSMDDDLFGILKVSYESLGSNENHMFLDFSCFLRGSPIIHLKEILDSCGFSSKSGFKIDQPDTRLPNGVGGLLSNSSSMSDAGEGRESRTSQDGENGIKSRDSAATRNGNQILFSQIESGWIAHYEPGVYITLVALHDGTTDLKRVRFSRRRFGERQAETWWSENRERVYERYNVRGSDKSSIPGQAAAGRIEQYEPAGRIEQYEPEPGVYMTLVALHDGTTDLKRVRFSRRKFGEHQAETWWSENRERVYERYNVRGSDKSSIPGQAARRSEGAMSTVSQP